MKNRLFFLFILFMMGFLPTNANVVDSISYKVNFDSIPDFNVITLTNHSKDTIYLFDTYFRDVKETWYNVFYRYNKKTNTCTESFLPLVPYLTVKHAPCIIVLGLNSVVRYGQTCYHFIKINPEDSVSFKIKYTHHFDKVFKSIDVRKYSKFDKEIKFKTCFLPYTYFENLEFAIYKDISLLLSDDDFHFNEVNFNNQALSYEVLTIPLGKMGAIR